MDCKSIDSLVFILIHAWCTHVPNASEAEPQAETPPSPLPLPPFTPGRSSGSIFSTLLLRRTKRLRGPARAAPGGPCAGRSQVPTDGRW